LEQQTSRREAPPFWAHAWPGSLALARWVFDAPHLVSGQRILDFASGCGASAIAAAKVGASEVFATDIDEHAVEATLENAKLNRVAVNAQRRDVIGVDEGWSMVLVGDVFYEAELSRQVFSWLRALTTRGATVFIGDPGRSFLPRDSLECVASYALDPVPAWDSVTDRPPKVWRLHSNLSH
jgi:predicted nicotinamide N-methyase